MDEEAPMELVDDHFDDCSIEDAPVDDNGSFYNPDASAVEEEVEPTSENFRPVNRYKPSQHTPRELPTIREEKYDARSNTSSRATSRRESDKSNDISGHFGFQSGCKAIDQFTEAFFSVENRAERLFPESELTNKGYVSPVRDKQNSWEPSVCHYEKQPTPEVQNNSPGLIFANISTKKELSTNQSIKNPASIRDRSVLFNKQNDENLCADQKLSLEKSVFVTSPLNSTKYETKTSTPKRPGNPTRVGQRGLPSFECSTIYESPQRSPSPSRLFSSRHPTISINPTTVGETNSDTMLSNRTINESMVKRVIATKKDNDLLTALEQARKRRDQKDPKPDFRLNINNSKFSTKAPTAQFQNISNRNTITSSQLTSQGNDTAGQSSSQNFPKPQGTTRSSTMTSDISNSNTANSTNNISRLSTSKTEFSRPSKNRGGFSDSSASTVVPNCSSTTSLNKDRDGRDSVSSIRTISRASSTMTMGGSSAQSSAALKPIRIVAKRLVFGTVPVNETLTMELEIENISDRQCQVRSTIDSKTTAIKIIDNKMTIIDPKKSMKLRISFTPHSPGRYQLCLSIEVPAQNFHQKLPIWGIGGVSNIIPTAVNIHKTSNPSEFALLSTNINRISFKLSNTGGDKDGFALLTIYDSSMRPVSNEFVSYYPARGVIVKKKSIKEIEIRINTPFGDQLNGEYRTSSAMSTASSITSLRRRRSAGADYVVQICWGEEALRERVRMLEFRTGQTELIDDLDFTSHHFHGEDDVRKPPEGYPTLLNEDRDLLASSYRSLYISIFSSKRELFAFRDTMQNSSSSASGNDVTVLETTAFRHQTFVNDVTMLPKPAKRH